MWDFTHFWYLFCVNLHIFHTWIHKIVYKRLTDDELKKMQKSYNYDLNADNSVPDNSKF